ncbi:hypothetical protein PHJA_001303700 [Phtheirospermum japonicum]|uniref:Uncharacterized protein n=1 Tax=Phtheirospermum japonicum TaxID=374723 RepID=A0A830BUE7_9LAMI|nr:hypothetical protein PHJA_001303700 [Phtheirospermum japonicum]
MEASEKKKTNSSSSSSSSSWLVCCTKFQCFPTNCLASNSPPGNGYDETKSVAQRQRKPAGGWKSMPFILGMPAWDLFYLHSARTRAGNRPAQAHRANLQNRTWPKFHPIGVLEAQARP